MNSYRRHSASFYVLDAAACGGDFCALWRDLEFAPTEDIVIISIKNDSRRDNHLRTAIKAKLEQRACPDGEHMCGEKDQYELVDPNFQFEGNSFILMVRAKLRKDICQVHCKNVKLRVRRCYGKSYRRTMRHYFNHFMTRTPALGGDSPEQVGVEQLETERMGQRMTERIIRRMTEQMAKPSRASQSPTRPPRRCARRRSEGTNGCAKIEAEGDTDARAKRHDENVVTCVTFMFKGVTLCVCLSNFDMEKHVERGEYYRCLLGGGRRRGSGENRPGSAPMQRECRPADPRSNYAEVYLENYFLCYKQMYNHFTSSMSFETDKDDLHLFSMDIVVLQGFNPLLLFNHLVESNLHNDSLIWGNNVSILNKSEKNLLQKRSYFTLTCSGKNAEFVSFGFKFCCDLFFQVEVSIVDDFFLSHVGEARRGEGEHLHIGVKPEVLELGSVYTYQVFQASFQLDYVNAGGDIGQVCEKGGHLEGLSNGQPDEQRHLEGSENQQPHNRGHLSFSILCFDSKRQSTIPINLYSYLHLKKNSIFKYLEENVRFGSSQSSGKRKECRPAPADQQNNVDMLRHIYVHPHKGIVKQNEQKKIQLNIYVDHMLKREEVVEGSFILIIRIHRFGKDIKQIFLTCRYSLQDNIVSTLLRDDRPLVRTHRSNHAAMRGRRGPRKTTTVKTNLSLHSRSRRSGFGTCNRTKRLDEAKGRPFLPVNITKFVLYSFFAIDRYEQELVSGVETSPEEVPSKEADQPLHLLGLSNLRTDHLVYCFSPTSSSSTEGEDKKAVECNLNYHWKKHFFCVQYPQEKHIDENFFLQNDIMQSNVKRQSGNVPLEVHYLVSQLQSSGKVDRSICVGTILFLWEELFRVLTPPLGTFAKVTQMVTRIYNHPRLRRQRKMHLIFRVIVKKSPSVLYKNIFLILLSFLKKLFFYFACVCLHRLGVSLGGGQIEPGGISGGSFGTHSPLGAPRQVGPTLSFPFFLRAFHFFHVSFLSYVSTFFLSFLDHQIGLYLAHYLLFYV
ncbi:hypothetical protein C922_00013 [Plasmodium inui San Antonio 1]|uniref:Uncharacterized protein n=1 Tax=Plasmodium inui San Antonio 1 TaxID=1237626 RepID=W7ABT2_9APIC|nr:hypothetical protein C922_00013 [Plasmodium inui San Antonio 1]EUD69150.1 hypothetical protein C922_00013 [Plasmodium inui San Antonio 1]